MDMLKTPIRALYHKYFFAAFGSALITSIYTVVDMAAVGHYHGPIGTSSLAVIAPMWNIVLSLGLLAGIGGSVLYANCIGAAKREEADQYFTAAMIIAAVLSLCCGAIFYFFPKPMFVMFGATEETLQMSLEYIHFIRYVLPLYLLNQTISVFVRADNDPALATAGIVSGGIFNIFGDYVFVFVFRMGICGAGLATALGAVLSTAILLTHFVKKSNALRFRIPACIKQKIGSIVQIGCSSFVVDFSMGILTIVFNRQIVRYLSGAALSVYGVIVTISTFVQCCAYGVGQASQPIYATNFGAKRYDRVMETSKYAYLWVALFGIVWTVGICAAPNAFIRLFMEPTEEVAEIAPAILRTYGVSFLLLPFNVYATFYFQAVLKPGVSMMISIGRSVVLSCILLYLLPWIFGGSSVWSVMAIVESVTAVYVLYKIAQSSKEMKRWITAQQAT